ncbi:hypothetical protein H5410_002546, partial [Solanum commersonii]
HVISIIRSIQHSGTFHFLLTLVRVIEFNSIKVFFNSCLRYVEEHNLKDREKFSSKRSKTTNHESHKEKTG